MAITALCLVWMLSFDYANDSDDWMTTYCNAAVRTSHQCDADDIVHNDEMMVDGGRWMVSNIYWRSMSV